MGRSLRIGSAFGIGLYLHWTFFIIPALVVFSTWRGGLDDVVLGISLTAALFGCVLLHELGHALMARRFGIGTRDITLLPIGGVARLERMSEHPGEEIAIAVAGPLVNVVIAAGVWGGLILAGLGNLPFVSTDELFTYGSPADVFLAMLFKTNVGLVLFNLIPAFPMDGGRVFRAFLALMFGRIRGTEIAVGLSKVLAAGFILGGILGFIPIVGVAVSPMLAVIGVFILAAGSQELAMLRYQHQRRFGPPAGAVPSVLPVDQPAHPVYPVQAGFSGFTWDPRAGAWVEWRDGRPVAASYVNRSGPSW
jgi:Zn-dependent protease